MDEEDVAADVLTKLFFCGSDIPDMKFFEIFFWLRTKEDVMEIKICMIAK